MGIAIISGILESLETRLTTGANAVGTRPSASGVSTPIPSYMLYASDDSLPSRFIACVRRAESARKLEKLFTSDFGEERVGKDGMIEVCAGQNVPSVLSSDVVLLW